MNPLSMPLIRSRLNTGRTIPGNTVSVTSRSRSRMSTWWAAKKKFHFRPAQIPAKIGQGHSTAVQRQGGLNQRQKPLRKDIRPGLPSPANTQTFNFFPGWTAGFFATWSNPVWAAHSSMSWRKVPGSGPRAKVWMDWALGDNIQGQGLFACRLLELVLGRGIRRVHYRIFKGEVKGRPASGMAAPERIPE